MVEPPRDWQREWPEGVAFTEAVRCLVRRPGARKLLRIATVQLQALCEYKANRDEKRSGRTG